ncbi:MAG: hypothetical protein N5P05_003372 [Chroococcopsis gigantea SAG 12.99]|jgi:hypothetical protein|nr:hypothetical protein [Chroococcopsis gigantea SAG 12.99]
MFGAFSKKALIAFLLSCVLFVSACAKAPSPYAQVQKETTGRGAAPAVAKPAEQGAQFNKFFPDKVKGYDIIPTQEKKGFAEYKVNKDGKTVAMLSINDTVSVPAAAEKYRNSTAKVANYPTVEQGTTTTGLLVNDRYQVKVLSRDPEFTRDERVSWLQKFDLKGLAKLPALPQTTANKLAPQKTAKFVPAPTRQLVPQPAT